MHVGATTRGTISLVSKLPVENELDPKAEGKNHKQTREKTGMRKTAGGLTRTKAVDTGISCRIRAAASRAPTTPGTKQRLVARHGRPATQKREGGQQRQPTQKRSPQ